MVYKLIRLHRISLRDGVVRYECKLCRGRGLKYGGGGEEVWELRWAGSVGWDDDEDDEEGSRSGSSSSLSVRDGPSTSSKIASGITVDDSSNPVDNNSGSSSRHNHTHHDKDFHVDEDEFDDDNFDVKKLRLGQGSRMLSVEDLVALTKEPEKDEFDFGFNRTPGSRRFQSFGSGFGSFQQQHRPGHTNYSYSHDVGGGSPSKRPRSSYLHPHSHSQHSSQHHHQYYHQRDHNHSYGNPFECDIQ